MLVVITLTYIAYITFYEKPEHKTDETIVSEKEQKKLAVDSGIISFVGKSSKAVIDAFGKPDRIDPSRYDYEWWVYNKDLNHYKQFGILDGKVVTVYGIGKDVNLSPFKIGQTSDQIFHLISPVPYISVKIGLNSYRFELSESDMNVRPTVPFTRDVYVQLYIDKYNGALSSVRAFNAHTFVKQRPYEMAYRGNLLEAEPIPEAKWRKIEQGEERQIFDITNVIRKRTGLATLKWNGKAAGAAYLHSKEMSDKGYFSHESPEKGTLLDRLTLAEVSFELAGENIAQGYMDGIDAVEGWLNSPGHRKNLLENRFTQLGVGVYRNFYTQNFIK